MFEVSVIYKGVCFYFQPSKDVDATLRETHGDEHFLQTTTRRELHVQISL